MSVQSQIDRINENVANTYNALEGVGADMPNTRNTENLPETVISIKAVRYDEQPLTEEQKAQARENIGAADAEKISEVKETLDNFQKILFTENAEPPVSVESIEDCTDESKIYILPDGYMYAHMSAYISNYTNLLPTAVGADGDVFGGVGYEYQGIYINATTGEEKEGNQDSYATGFIPFTIADVLRIKDVPWNNTVSRYGVCAYDANKQYIGFVSALYLPNTYNADTNVTTIRAYDYEHPDTSVWKNVAFVRFRCNVWSDTDFTDIPVPVLPNGIITVNEEIIDSHYAKCWVNTGYKYQPTLDARITELENDVAEIKENGTKSLFDYTAYGLPVLYMNGDTSAMTKDVKVTLNYVYGDRTGTLTCKWQGNSSIGYPKKNYTVKFDTDFEAHDGWGEESKYCLKANWVDFTHARNIVSAKLWGEVVRSRSTANERLNALVNAGAIDGFPICVVINDKYQGIYTFNIPKDGWMFGMGGGENEALLNADILVAKGEETRFKEEASVGGGIEVEYAPDEDNVGWIFQSVNRLINACINSDGTDLDTTISQYLDWDSAIDYVIFSMLISNIDGACHNYLLSTYDGVKWAFTPYDMDMVFGVGYSWTFDPVWNPAIQHFSRQHRVWELVTTYKKSELKARYTQLRNDVLSEDYVITAFANFINKFPKAMFDEEVKIWPEIPNTSMHNFAQIADFYKRRCDFVDRQIGSL